MTPLLARYIMETGISLSVAIYIIGIAVNETIKRIVHMFIDFFKKDEPPTEKTD